MKNNYYTISSFSLATFSIILSTYMGDIYLYHDSAFYAAATTGIIMLVLLLFRMSQVQIKDHEIKNQDWTTPLVYALGFVLLIVFYTIEWYLLGCYGPPNPESKQLLISEIANHPELIDAIYFSIITSTTLGYGDFAPLTNGAKMLAATQALTCSIYTVTGLAILLNKRREPISQ